MNAKLHRQAFFLVQIYRAGLNKDINEKVKKMEGPDMSKSIKCGKTSKGQKKKWNIQVLQKIISLCKINNGSAIFGSPEKQSERQAVLGFGIKIFQIPKSRFIADEEESWQWFPTK